MPKSANEVFRDFVRFTGDGLPNAPVGHPLPIGDPASGKHHPSKPDIRDWAGGVDAAVDRAEDAAANAAAAQEAAEDARDEAIHAAEDARVEALIDDIAALLASTTTWTAGALLETRTEGFRYRVVADASQADLTTAGAVMVRALPAGGAYDVGQFGAIGDGVTDATAAIQGAIDAAAARGGKVHLPPGDYFVSATLYLPSHTSILAQGARIIASEVEFPRNERMNDAVEHGGYQSNSRPVISNTDPAGGNLNILIDGLTIYSNYTGPNHTMHLRRITGLTISNCELHRGRSAIALLACKDFSVTRCRIYAHLNGGVDTWEGCQNGAISHNLIDGSDTDVSDVSTHGIFVTPGPTDDTDPAIHTARNIAVIGNIVKNTRNTGLWAGGGAGNPSRAQDAVKHLMIVGNTFDNIGNIAGATGGYGVLIDRGDTITISGNTFNNIAQDGIFTRKGLTSGDALVVGVAITGNSFKNVGIRFPGYFVRLSDTSSSVIAGNVGRGSTHLRPLLELESCQQNTIGLNRWPNGTDGGVLMSGTDGEYTIKASVSWDIPLVPHGGQVSRQVTVEGAIRGKPVIVTTGAEILGLMVWGQIKDPGELTIYASNMTGNTIDIGTVNFNITVMP